jgi:hypothetical protein
MKDQLVEYAKRYPVPTAVAGGCALILLFLPGGFILRLILILVLIYTCLKAGKHFDL